MKMLVANVIPEETRAAVIDDGRLCDYAVERDDETHIVNHIYKGVVQNILPAMQAAFIDIGRKKNAFLYLGDLFPRAATKEEVQQTHISVGQSVLVQAVKDEQPMKGAKVTANVSIAGRYAVLMPTVDYIGVSKKVRDEEERDRLRAVVASVKPEGMGMIVRTVAAGVSEAELTADLQYLLRTWESIQRRYKLAKKPKILYREADLLMRMIRDYFTDDVGAVIVDNKEAYERITGFFAGAEEAKRKVVLYAGEEPLFDYYHIEDELQCLTARQVSLPSGGSLIFDHTEALTVIDVNSGKYVGSSTLENTLFHVNKEAAAEIARQLRLRDIGGIVLVDFIDMNDSEKREEILHILQRETAADRARVHVFGMTALNLVEITRRKSRQGLYQAQYSPCNVCGGTGTLASPESVYINIVRQLRHMTEVHHIKGDILISAHDDVLALFRDKKRKEGLERELARKLFFEKSGHANREVFSVFSHAE